MKTHPSETRAGKLPELPEPTMQGAEYGRDGHGWPIIGYPQGYTADEMHAYALEALAASEPGEAVFTVEDACDLDNIAGHLRDIERGVWKAKDWDVSDQYVNANIGHAKRAAAWALPAIDRIRGKLQDVISGHTTHPAPEQPGKGEGTIAASEIGDDERTTCTVAVAPGTTFGVGIKLSTIVNAIRDRAKWGDGPYHFNRGTYGKVNPGAHPPENDPHAWDAIASDVYAQPSDPAEGDACALDEALRRLQPPSDVVGGAEEYGFSRARDMAAHLVRAALSTPPTAGVSIDDAQGRCIWPDCGHDTNQSDPTPGCNGIGCPQPPATVRIDEAMTLAACNAYDRAAELDGEELRELAQYPWMHAALTAALDPQVKR